MKKIISAGIVPFYYNHGVREYLILQHAGESTYWDFPKGKLEVGENNHQAALRELEEETGISASIVSNFEHSLSYYFKDSDGQLGYKTVYFYIGKATTRYVVLSHEHREYIWLAYEKARERLTYDAAKDLLEKVHVFLEKIKS